MESLSSTMAPPTARGQSSKKEPPALMQFPFPRYPRLRLTLFGFNSDRSRQAWVPSRKRNACIHFPTFELSHLLPPLLAALPSSYHTLRVLSHRSFPKLFRDLEI